MQGLAGARERPAARRRSQRQRWELAAAALEHLGACLALLGAPAPGGADGREAPGTAVMLDLLREREGARGAWAALAGGVDALLAERRDAPWGAAKEAAALAALRLLRLALERDGAAVAALRRAPQAGAARRAALIQTLTFTLRRRRSDRRRRSMRSRV